MKKKLFPTEKGFPRNRSEFTASAKSIEDLMSSVRLIATVSSLAYFYGPNTKMDNLSCRLSYSYQAAILGKHNDPDDGSSIRRKKNNDKGYKYVATKGMITFVALIN